MKIINICIDKTIINDRDDYSETFNVLSRIRKWKLIIKRELIEKY